MVLKLQKKCSIALTLKCGRSVHSGRYNVKPGDVAMVVEGKIQSLLQTERLMPEHHAA